jgi:peptide/nickel transport system permease protein
VTGFILRRLLQSILVILIVTIMVFLMMRLLPGDPILLMVTSSEAERFTPEQLALLRHEFGLDRPMITQYFDWMSNMFNGDLGTSIRYRTPVTHEISKSLPITLHLGLLSFVIGFIIGLPAGVICAVRRGTWIDTVVTVLANLGITVPSFWLAIMLMYLISLQLRWLPIYGYVSPFDNFWDSTRHIILPVFCLCIFGLAGTARQARSSMLEVLRQDYIRTAWAKGLRERMVIVRHALKNALIPVVTLTGLGLAHIIGGAVLVETVFSIPGMGRLAVTAITTQDYPIIQAITLIVAAVVVLVNLIIDISMGWLDPRIRFG